MTQNNSIDDKKYSILLLLSDSNKQLQPLLPGICNSLIKLGHDVHVIYSSLNLDEEFEINLRKVPWIHAQKLPIGTQFGLSQFSNIFAIRRYIKRHDEINIIHSFGANCGILSVLAGICCKNITINTPDQLNNKNAATGKAGMLIQLINDNLNYIFTRIYSKVLFTSQKQQTEMSGNIIYRNVPNVLVDFAQKGDLGEALLGVYGGAVKI